MTNNTCNHGLVTCVLRDDVPHSVCVFCDTDLGVSRNMGRIYHLAWVYARLKGDKKRGAIFKAKWEKCKVRLDVTAPGSIVIKLGDDVLYEANTFGLNVIVFRDGPWVDRFLHDAQALEDQQNAARLVDAKARRAEKERERRAKFSSVDY